jgi:hypothetical protein
LDDSDEEVLEAAAALGLAPDKRDEYLLQQLERDVVYVGHKIPIRAPNTSDIRIFMYF